MSRYVTSNTDRNQINLTPVSLEELISEDNLARVIDIFADSFDFAKMEFQSAKPKATGCKPYNPADMLKN